MCEHRDYLTLARIIAFAEPEQNTSEKVSEFHETRTLSPSVAP